MSQKRPLRNTKLLIAAEVLGLAALALSSPSRNFPVVIPISVGGKDGFVDAAGETVFGAVFLVCKEGKNQAVALMVDGKRACLDLKGRFRFSADDPKPSSDVVAFSERSPGSSADAREQWGFADSAGRVIVEPRFDEFQGFSEGVGRVVKNRLWGFVDSNGKVLVEPRFKIAYWFSEGLSCVLLDDSKWGYVDRLGRVVSDPRYEYLSVSFSEGLVPAKRDGKWGYVDRNFKFVIDPRFDHASSFSEGLAWVWAGGKTSPIDHMGRMVIEPRVWDMAFGFSEGLAVVRPRRGDLFGYIDRTGQAIIPFRFVEAGPFRGGLARVTESSEAPRVAGCWQGYSYINRFGDYVWRGRSGN
jgi:hypothetical protein